jgi:dephospho-CoA kinase
MKYILGLTGQSGAGKSSLHSVAKEQGFLCIDCDKVAHGVLEIPETVDALTAAFGSGILENGVLSRKKLAAAAFVSKAQTELLNSITLPRIVNEINRIIEQSEKDKILLDAPTLYESGADKLCDGVVAVLSERESRKKRIIERDNLSEAEAELRLSAEKSDEYYISKADKIIYNNGNLAEFQKDFRKTLNEILGGNNDE